MITLVASWKWTLAKGFLLTISCAIFSLVPRSRTTTGTFLIPSSLYASTIPSAIMSQRVSPPKILIKTTTTRGSFSMMLSEVLTVSGVALPPVSRKLAHIPPRSAIASLVFMARPAPLTFLTSAKICGGEKQINTEGANRAFSLKPMIHFR